MRFFEFFQRGGRCGNTTVPVVAVGAHGCRSVAALVYAHADKWACDWPTAQNMSNMYDVT